MQKPEFIFTPTPLRSRRVRRQVISVAGEWEGRGTETGGGVEVLVLSTSKIC